MSRSLAQSQSWAPAENSAENSAESTAESACIEIASVTKSFAGVCAVDAVSLRIARGEFFSLLGPSGCGKTTLLRILAGFERPDAGHGSVFLFDREVTELPPYQRDLGMVFQSYALFPHLSAAKNVAFGLEERKRPKEEIDRRVRAGFDLVRLPYETFAERMPAELSGGQKQRIALARALVLEPKILLLDEPLAALDLKLRREMQLELKALHHRVGITFVFVTHDQEEALMLSDRVAVMRGGRVVRVGTPREVYEHPRSRFVASFLGEANFFRGTVALASAGFVLATDDGPIALPRDPTLAEGQQRVIAIRPERLRIATASDRESTLRGTIVDQFYRGDVLRAIVRTPAGVEFAVALRGDRPDAESVAARGCDVEIAIDEDAIRFVEDDG